MPKKWKQRKDGVWQRYNCKDKKGGNCYEVAARVLVDRKLPQGVLVHGSVWHPKTGRHGHAWVEMGDVVFDFANNKSAVMRKEKYYSLGRVQNTKKYTRKQAVDKMLDTEHFGPWGDDQ